MLLPHAGESFCFGFFVVAVHMGQVDGGAFDQKDRVGCEEVTVKSKCKKQTLWYEHFIPSRVGCYVSELCHR